MYATKLLTYSAQSTLRAELQQRPTDAMLWYAYAQLEISVWGNVQAARKVFVEVLAASHPDRDSRQDFFLAALWALWIEVTWDSADCQRIVYAAGMCQLGAAPSRSVLLDYLRITPLRATEKLQALRWLRSAAEQGSVGVWTLAIAEQLFQDTPVGDEFAQSTAIFLNALEQAPSVELADACQQFVSMVCRSSTYVVRPREARAVTTSLLQRYPTNTVLLYSLMAQEAHARLEHHVQHTVEHVLVPHLGATADDFELRWVLVLATQLPNSPSTHHARQLVDRALHVAPRAARLWHMALSYELHLLDIKSIFSSHHRIRALLYQSLRHCPYDKSA